MVTKFSSHPLLKGGLFISVGARIVSFSNERLGVFVGLAIMREKIR